MSILSNLVRNISAPVAKVASIIPNPIAQGVALVSGQIAQDTARRDFKRAQEQERQRPAQPEPEPEREQRVQAWQQQRRCAGQWRVVVIVACCRGRRWCARGIARSCSDCHWHKSIYNWHHVSCHRRWPCVATVIRVKVLAIGTVLLVILMETMTKMYNSS